MLSGQLFIEAAHRGVHKTFATFVCATFVRVSHLLATINYVCARRTQ